jgi:hypothetical protein
MGSWMCSPARLMSTKNVGNWQFSQTCRVQWDRGNVDVLKFFNTHTHAYAHSPCPFFLPVRPGKFGKSKMSHTDVRSSRMGERWAIWNLYRHRQADTHARTHFYTTRLSKKTSCMSLVGSLQFPRTHVFKADGGNVGKVKFTHARSLRFMNSGEM